MIKRFVSLAFIVVLFVAGCATVPLTGRSQLSLVSQAEMTTLGADSYRQFLEQSDLSRDARAKKMVTDVGTRIAASAEAFLREQGLENQLSEYQWEFNLVEADTVVNAFCLPGGRIGIYSGILPVAQNEAGLAVVMGHEVAHAIANHSGERMSQLLLLQMGGIALSKALQEQPEKTQELLMLAFGIGANVGVLLPYSRKHESEADRIGLILMARAGYDPNAAIPFWQRMTERGGSRPPEFLSTHPAPEKRIDEIRDHLPEAMEYYEQ